MKYRSLLVLFIVISVSCSGSQDSVKTQESVSKITTDTQTLLSYQDEITEAYLKNHLTPFAADSMKGRETGMPGQKKAARFLVQEYDRLGLKPVGDNNSYLQKFDLTAQQLDSIAFGTFSIGKDSVWTAVSTSLSSSNSSANYIRQFGGSSKIEAEIVFAGFGIQSSELNIDNLSGANLKGKWVMVFGGDPPQVIEGDSLYTDQRQFARQWFRNLLQKGVAGILTIPEMSMEEFAKAAERNQTGFGEPTGMQLAYRAQEERGPNWSYTMVSPAHAAKILNLKDGTKELAEYRDQVRKNIKDFNAKETGYRLVQIPYEEEVTVETENVVAMLEGAAPKLKDQVVVLSAHYDHVGVGEPDSTGDAIYNGANDDGSGTIGILAAARAFSKASEKGVRPKRSVLFLSVSAEEKGLLGSRYYSDHPIIPMEKTVANLNTDMIGRVDPEHQKSGVTDYVYIIGGDIISSELDSLLKAGNRQSGNLKLDMRYNDLNDPNQFYRRSDHWNFGRFGVPFVFFFNGVHEDYHRPSDEVEKMNFDLLAKTVRSMYATTVMVANADSAPKVDNQEFIEITKEN